MSTSYLAILVLTGVIFIAWTIIMFRTLFGHRARAAARTGKSIPGVKDTIHEWQHWWRSPDLRASRRLLIGLTLALMGLIAMMSGFSTGLS